MLSLDLRFVLFFLRLFFGSVILFGFVWLCFVLFFLETRSGCAAQAGLEVTVVRAALELPSLLRPEASQC